MTEILNALTGYNTGTINALMRMNERWAGHEVRPTPEQRGFVAPLYQAKGSATPEFGWPDISGVPAFSRLMNRLLQTPYTKMTPEQKAGVVGDSFDAGGAAMIGGMMAPRPRGSIGMSGREGAKSGSGLDMSREARMARAEAMGVDTGTVWYHGTVLDNLDTIKPGMKEPGAWFTTDINNANNYARGDTPRIYETFLRPKKTFVVRADYDDAGNIILTHNGEMLDLDSNVDIVKHAQRLGYDSVHFPDGNYSESGNTMVVFDPRNIRSVNAAFDPAMSNSTNLLAANPSSAALPGMLGYVPTNNLNQYQQNGAPDG